MTQESTVKPTPLMPSDLQLEWDTFRRTCFSRYSNAQTAPWIWSTGTPCDLVAIVILVAVADDFLVEFRGDAVWVRAYGHRYIVPMAQLHADAMAGVQAVMTTAQAAAAEKFSQAVRGRAERPAGTSSATPTSIH